MNEDYLRIVPLVVILRYVAGELGIVDCGLLLEWSRVRRSDARRHGGNIARAALRDLRAAEQFWLKGRRRCGRATTPFTACYLDVRELVRSRPGVSVRGLLQKPQLRTRSKFPHL
jgi:hypothetical protein